MSYVTLRWILVNLRGGTVELRLETGGRGLRREDRVYSLLPWESGRCRALSVELWKAGERERESSVNESHGRDCRWF